VIEMQLCYDRNKKRTVLVCKERIFCEICQAQLVNTVIVHRSYSRIMPMKEHLYCHKCSKAKIMRNVDTFNLCDIESEIKKEYVIINYNPPEIHHGDISVFQAAFLKSEKIVGNTIHANRESFEGAKIGDSSFLDKEERKLIYEPEIDRFLANIKNAKPIIPKQLEAN
jgi:hypothetical protein